MRKFEKFHNEKVWRKINDYAKQLSAGLVESPPTLSHAFVTTPEDDLPIVNDEHSGFTPSTPGSFHLVQVLSLPEYIKERASFSNLLSKKFDLADMAYKTNVVKMLTEIKSLTAEHQRLLGMPGLKKDIEFNKVQVDLVVAKALFAQQFVDELIKQNMLSSDWETKI